MDAMITAKKKVAKRKTPTRAIEGDYLAILGSKCSPARWEAIVSKTVEQAEEGDYRARDFLARWVLPKDKSLLELAYEERRGMTSERQVEDFKPIVIK